MNVSLGRIIVCALLISLTGCSALKISPTDHAAAKVTKGLVRTVLFPVTLGRSEVYYRIERAMASWLGSHKDELYSVWGPPVSIVSLSTGGQVIGYSTDVIDGFDGNITAYTAQRFFTTNAAGRIVQYRWTGM